MNIEDDNKHHPTYLVILPGNWLQTKHFWVYISYETMHYKFGHSSLCTHYLFMEECFKSFHIAENEDTSCPQKIEIS